MSKTLCVQAPDVEPTTWSSLMVAPVAEARSPNPKLGSSLSNVLLMKGNKRNHWSIANTTLIRRSTSSTSIDSKKLVMITTCRESSTQEKEVQVDQERNLRLNQMWKYKINQLKIEWMTLRALILKYQMILKSIWISAFQQELDHQIWITTIDKLNKRDKSKNNYANKKTKEESMLNQSISPKKPWLLERYLQRESQSKLLKVATLLVQLMLLFHLGQEKWLDLVIW